MPILLIFILILSLVYTIFLSVLMIGLDRLLSSSKTTSDARPMISVLVPVRNEVETLENCLNALLSQNYPPDQYEIILINDHSTDGSAEIISKYAETEQNIIAIDNLAIQPEISPKKQAIETGISRAQGEIILTTDADCLVPPGWFKQSAKSFNESTALAASWLLVDPGNTILGRMESLDSLGFVLIGAASFGLGKPFLANAANLAYRKEVFLEIDGFSGNKHLGSGDDDLLLQKLSKSRWKSLFNTDSSNTVWTRANTSFAGFFQQRVRWASKGKHYHIALILLELFVFLFYISTTLSILLSITGIWPVYTLLLFVVKIILDTIFIQTGCRHLNRSFHYGDMFLTELLQLVYIPIVGIAGLTGSFKWKDRTYLKGALKG